MRHSMLLAAFLLCAPSAAPAEPAAEKPAASEAKPAASEAKPAASEAKPAASEAKPAGTGLVVEHLVVGEGPSPKVTDTVRVHYHGTFSDGRVFDSSVERGKPARFPLNRVIACWTQGLQEMKVGGKAKLTCPPAIAYGARGMPPRIPPNSTLFFEVELLGIEAPPGAARRQ